MKNGIEITVKGQRIFLDPKTAKGISFISHAHSDHCPRRFSGTLFTSVQTCALMRVPVTGECWHRGTSIGEVRFSLHDSGHMIGSKQLLIENGSRILYTGDLNTYGGLLTGPAQTPKCDILILEATFGTPRFVFPEKAEVLKEIIEWIEGVHELERTPVLLGYAVGKAQELTRAVSKHYPTYVDSSIHEFNQKTQATGVDLGPYKLYSEDKMKEEHGDHVIITTPSNAKYFHRRGFSLAFASGWTVAGWWKQRYPGTTGFALSDHSDFYGLLDFVKKVDPQVVYTHHGFAKELSCYLREMGTYSEPLKEAQAKLDMYC